MTLVGGEKRIESPGRIRATTSRLLQLAAFFAISVALTGCTSPLAGSPMPYDEPTKAGFEGALTRYSLAVFVEDDKAFCSMTDKKLLYRMAVAYSVDDDECSKVVKLLAKQQRLMMKMGLRDHLSNFKIEGHFGSVIQTVELGRSVQLMRIRAEHRGGQWVVTDEEEIREGGSARPRPNLSQS